MIEKAFVAHVDNLYPILHWIKKELKKINISDSDLKKIELAMEEAIVNIIFHSYNKKKENIEIAIDLKRKNVIEIHIMDHGPEFNPLLEDIKIDPEIPLEDREIGGLGVFLIRQYTDEVVYKREKSKNILTLKKKISSY